MITNKDKGQHKKFKETYFYLFIIQFFSIGKSAGSLIQEAISLFRTFQRLSAPHSFAAVISPECIDMFKWATNIIRIITKFFQTEPLSTYENFIMTTLILPITTLVIISSSLTGSYFFILLPIYGACFLFGYGLGLLKPDPKLGKMVLLASLIPLSVIILWSGLVWLCHKCESKTPVENENDQQDEKEKKYYDISRFFPSTYTFIVAMSGFFLFLLMMPITIKRFKFAIIIAAIIVVLLIATAIYHKVTEYNYIEPQVFVGRILNLNGFLINCFSLFIIPSTESFVELVQDKHYQIYHTIISYLLISLVLPITLILTMILSKHPDLEDTYRKTKNKKFNLLHFIELIDILKQIAYAVLATFDIVWACLVTELLWAILICVTRPYNEKSSYPLILGSSLVIVISNSALLAANPIGFEISITIVAFAITPAIAALYIYFFFDFKMEIEEEAELSIEKVSSIHKMSFVANIIAPFGFICYGMFLPFFTGNMKPMPP